MAGSSISYLRLVAFCLHLISFIVFGIKYRKKPNPVHAYSVSYMWRTLLASYIEVGFLVLRLFLSLLSPSPTIFHTFRQTMSLPLQRLGGWRVTGKGVKTLVLVFASKILKWLSCIKWDLGSLSFPEPCTLVWWHGLSQQAHLIPSTNPANYCLASSSAFSEKWASQGQSCRSFVKIKWWVWCLAWANTQ